MAIKAIDNPIAEIFSKWGRAIESYVGAGHYSVAVSDTINKIPYARIYSVNARTSSTDLAGNEVCQTLTIRCESITGGQNALSDAYDLDNVQRNILMGLGFRCSEGAVYTQNADARLVRLVSTFTREYTGQIPDLEE